ncbi:MAG TPA: glycosyltransferase family 2 protein [Saprospiraceae bacterium]|nr:glycosyltransferase family 2 protein [Saprospiraceae bacterium]
MSVKLSVVIICFNEEKNIARCLESIKDLADEILIVDSFSNDKTLSICNEYQCRIIQNPFSGHIEQKNYAKNLATHDLVLSLDADECLDEILKASILHVKDSESKNAYSMNRLNYYAGHWVRHGGWYPDKKLRLWDKNSGHWGGENPHDKFILLDSSQKCVHLPGNILHYTYYSVEDHVKQTEYFSKIAAKSKFIKGKKYIGIMKYASAVYKWIYTYLIRLGFLDGKAGWSIAKISAYGNFLKYKLLEEHWNTKN